jgi:anaerobic magnesium-protoporphyrin IX monomethyl ester cyclase
MKKEVLLLVPPGFYYNTPPLGLLYIAAQLEQDRIPVKILDLGIEEMGVEESLRYVREMQPKVIGFSAFTPDFHIVDKFAFLVKKEVPDVCIVFGGPHPTLDPENVLYSKHIDFVVRGEGELTFSELVQAIMKDDYSGIADIKGISYRNSTGKVVHNCERQPVNDLDLIPLPARHLVPLHKYRNYGRVRKNTPVGVALTSRGCPLKCIFCAGEIFGKKFRAITPAKMIEEVKLLRDTYGVREIFFREDNFAVQKQRIYEFCDRMIKEKINMSWMCLIEAHTMTEDLARKMKEAGCWYVAMGVESGNQEIQKVLKKKLNLQTVKEEFAMLHRVGLKTLAFMMIGNYVDTEETVNDTIKYSCELDTDFSIFTVTAPIPGTELYELAKKDGLITNTDYDKITNLPLMFRQAAPILRTKTLSPERLRQLQLKAITSFYLRPSHLWRLMKDPDLRRALFAIQPKGYSFYNKTTEDIYKRYDAARGYEDLTDERAPQNPRFIPEGSFVDIGSY